MTTIKAYAALEAGAPLQPFEYDAGEIGDHEVEIAVQSCGLCHSDLSMINNSWRASQYPLVPGHEAIGTVTALGASVRNLKIGQTVGIGWNSHSCMHCSPCLSGRQQRCETLTTTIHGRGGFADRVRVQDIWAVPLPEGLDTKSAGPLFCGGITVFAPLLDFDVKPTDRIGVIGIGGLGHLALQFTRAWGVGGQKSVGGSDTGAPDMVAKMLEFCARHDIKPTVEYFPMTQINDAIAHLRSGKARYRVVLTNG